MTYARLPQVNVEFSLRNHCKEMSLQVQGLMLQSRHFAAKCLTGKVLTEYPSTLPCGLGQKSPHYLGFQVKTGLSRVWLKAV